MGRFTVWVGNENTAIIQQEIYQNKFQFITQNVIYVPVFDKKVKRGEQNEIFIVTRANLHVCSTLPFKNKLFRGMKMISK